MAVLLYYYYFQTMFYDSISYFPTINGLSWSILHSAVKAGFCSAIIYSTLEPNGTSWNLRESIVTIYLRYVQFYGPEGLVQF